MKNSIFSIVLFLFSVTSYSQVSEQWVRTYSGPRIDAALGIAVDYSGNIYVTGVSMHSMQWGSEDYVTVKYNPSGDSIWVRRYSGLLDGGSGATSITVDVSGNCYVTGSSSGSGTGYDIATIKYDSAGVQQWVQRYNGAANLNDQGNSITVDIYGNVYVTGYSTISSSSSNVVTIKYNSSGNMQWVQLYTDNTNCAGYSVAVDGSGNIYVTGDRPTWNGSHCLTIKYNQAGIQQWVNWYTGGVTAAKSIALDNNSNIYISAYDALIKYNSAGVQQWLSDTGGISVKVDNSGNVYTTGDAYIYPNHIYMTAKYGSSGQLMWRTLYTGQGIGDGEPYALTLDNSGNAYVTGWSSNSNGLWDYATVKYNSFGVQAWAERHSGNDSRAFAIAVDVSGNVYVTGQSTGSYVTIKYSQLLGINPISSEIPKQFNLYQNYPNPFNPTTKIKFDLPKSNLTLSEAKGLSVKLTVYDILGREAATLVNEQLKPGSYEVEWNASNDPSGVYFYKLISGSFSQTKKLVLIK
jgi:hypothetical protein